ncbi:16S rRNA (uracil(1498)-N(3))-methyltransferase [Enhydrobacter sp.]|jgi:16S rRNA (uracil1498-N3)-methyltransferase|uniref:16S rRNA (uracil(1498)-N(3))-methyltransferase n=1 Tax=Enhydrobacter sp. TaxID=1894999 RepID=UPI002604A4A3|nr:16S rRNA (uracil(1498)-N(3))-methyltransferase [Enhydrobacter sp.]WIM12322.1 MAG: 16S rRNA (uracil(1498)-N(3))-methyltransferase [Enhydrobacter sp.]
MSVSRLFIEADLAAGVEVALDEAQAHYLRHVMRREEGASLLLFNGRDGEWKAVLSLRGRKAAVAVVEGRTRIQAEEPDVWLCFAPVKRARIDFIVEKATELGVSLLQPVLTQHTAVERVNVDRLRANAIEAAEQTERLSVPEVRRPVELGRLIDQWPAGRRLLMCDETGGGPPIAGALAALDSAARTAPWAIVIGPEGGFAQAELAALRRMTDVTPVGLGPRILRADTAALAALACWQAVLGDWREPTPRLSGDYRTARSAR